MKKIALTGGSGRVGQTVTRYLMEQGFNVIVIDIKPPQNVLQRWWETFRQCDVTDYGQTFAALHGSDIIVHLAADPRPDINHFTGAQRFHNNTLVTYNVFNAAVQLGVEKVIWASSETIYGYPFDEVEPDYAPVDEAHRPLPQCSYALSKLTGELLAQQFNRWSDIPFIGLQLSNILYEHDYEYCPAFWADSSIRRFDLWSYIDHRDVAQVIHNAIQADVSGAENFIIVADDTIMNCSTADLMTQHFPETVLKDDIDEFQSLMSNQKAKSMLGFVPQHSWRDHITADGTLTTKVLDHDD